VERLVEVNIDRSSCPRTGRAVERPEKADVKRFPASPSRSGEHVFLLFPKKRLSPPDKRPLGRKENATLARRHSLREEKGGGAPPFPWCSLFG